MGINGIIPATGIMYMVLFVQFYWLATILLEQRETTG